MNTFSLLTLNTFGLPFFMGWWRMLRMARELDSQPVSMLCLQEIQQNAYAALLYDRLGSFPHHAVEYNALAPKGGLVTSSKTPIVRREFIPYDNRGRWYSVGFADWMLQKGMLLTEVEVNGLSIIVLNTHIHANYGGVWAESNATSQIQRDQILHLAAQVRALPEDAFVVACGDFNFHRETFLYEQFLSESGLTDPLADDPRPTYKSLLPFMSGKWSVPLDFAFVRPDRYNTVQFSADIKPIEDSKARLPIRKFLSDHAALTLALTW